MYLGKDLWVVGYAYFQNDHINRVFHHGWMGVPTAKHLGWEFLLPDILT